MSVHYWDESKDDFTRRPASEQALEGAIRHLYWEVNCRIEHGAESGGHLEYVESRLGSILAVLDEAVRQG